MRRLLLLVVTLCALLGCSPKEQRRVPQTPSPSPSTLAKYTLVVMGDSLTEGYGVDVEQSYPAQLERRMQEDGLDWKVVNAGLSGETSSGARSRLSWVLKLQPDAVLLETGGNDGLRGIDPKLTKENLTSIVSELKRLQIPVMVAGMKTVTNMGEDYALQFEAIYPQVAKEQEVPLIGFFLDGVGGVPEWNQNDGIHPTAEGYAEIVKRTAPVVVPWLESLKR